MTLPQECYLICANARCGSTLLCRALSDTGLAGHPDEYFMTWPEPLRLIVILIRAIGKRAGLPASMVSPAVRTSYSSSTEPAPHRTVCSEPS